MNLIQGGIIFLLLWNCRGRSVVDTMPIFTGIQSDTFIIFTSSPEIRISAQRIHFITYPSSLGHEIDLSKKPLPIPEIQIRPHIQYKNYLIDKEGNHALVFLNSEKKAQNFSSFVESIFSPEKTSFLRSSYGNLITHNLATSEEREFKNNLSKCDWKTENEVFCLFGKYAKQMEIVVFNLDTQTRKNFFSVKTPMSIQHFKMTKDRSALLVGILQGKNQKIISVDTSSGKSIELGEIDDVFVKEIYPIDSKSFYLIATKRTSEPDKMNPYNVYMSKNFGIHKEKNFLLNFESLETPGFIFGDGYRGVESADLSPDGSKLAVLMSGKNDCKMVDEGGNISCRKDIYILEKDKTDLKRLTNFEMDTAVDLKWIEFQ